MLWSVWIHHHGGSAPEHQQRQSVAGNRIGRVQSEIPSHRIQAVQG